MMSQPPGHQPPRLDTYRPMDERMAPMPPARSPHGRGGPPGQRRRKKRGMGVLSWIGLILLSLVGLLGGAAAVLVMTMPKDFVRDQITAEVKARTGRDLIIAGPSSFQLYPSIGFALADVALSAPDGVSDKPLVKMAALEVAVRLLPLLSKQVAVERLILRDPVFELHVDANGRKTWDMAGLAQRMPVRLAQAELPAGTLSGAAATDAPAPSPATSAGGQAASVLEQLELGDVRIDNGTVHYSDARSGARHDVSAINVRLGLKSITKPLEAKGDLVWRGEKLDLDATVTSLKSVIEERPAKVVATLASAPVAITYDGTIAVRGSLDAEGSLSAKAPSVKKLARWLGTELPAVPGFGPLDFKGQVRVAGKVVNVSNAAVGLDGSTGSGQVTLDTSGARPYVKGALKLSELDLNKYIGGEGGAAATPANPSSPAATPEAAPATSIDELLKDGSTPSAPGPRVQGYTQRAGWSEGQIDASALGLADADVKLTLGRLLVKDIKVGPSQISVALKNQVLRATFDDVSLYDGRGKGFVTLDATQPQIVAVGSNLVLDGVSAQPLLKDAAKFDWLAGTGKVTIAVSGQGRNQRQIVETLTGKADVTFLNGAIVGWNVPALLQGVKQLKFPSFKRQPTEKTDFSELAATFNITNGLAQNDNLRLVSPALRVTGAGNIMLPAREIDYTARPVLAVNQDAQPAGQAGGLGVPVKIQGSWDDPKITPDLGGINANQAVDAVKQLGEQLKGKNAGDALKSLFGGEKSGGTATTEPGASNTDKAKQLLEGLFKQ